MKAYSHFLNSTILLFVIEMSFLFTSLQIGPAFIFIEL